jgi:hypothetical protein
MSGPALGAILYNAGGFMLPFEIFGSIATLVSILMLLIIPNVNISSQDDHSDSKYGYMELISIPGVILPFIDTFFCNFGVGMNDAMIGLYLQSLGEDSTVISIAFFLNGGCYMLSTILSGYIMDKLAYPTVIAILGNIGFVVALTIIGPLPFVPIETSVPLILMGMGIEGFSAGLVYVSSFTRSHLAATRNGFPEDTKTYHLLSGMWVSFGFMGFFFGPSIGGIAVQTWGFRMTTVIYWIGYLIILAADVIEFCRLKAKNNEYTELKTKH